MRPSGEIGTPGLLSFSLSYTLSLFCLVALHLLFTSLTVTCHLCTCLLTTAPICLTTCSFTKVSRPANIVSTVESAFCSVLGWSRVGQHLASNFSARVLPFSWLNLQLQNSQQNNLQGELNKAVISN